MNYPKVGDKVCIAGSLSNKRIDTIIKVTKTQITVTNGMRFLISTGRNVGATQWHRYYFTVISPEKADELNREWEEAEVKRHLVYKLSNYQWKDLDTPALQRIVDTYL